MYVPTNLQAQSQIMAIIVREIVPVIDSDTLQCVDSFDKYTAVLLLYLLSEKAMTADQSICLHRRIQHHSVLHSSKLGIVFSNSVDMVMVNDMEKNKVFTNQNCFQSLVLTKTTN